MNQKRTFFTQIGFLLLSGLAACLLPTVDSPEITTVPTTELAPAGLYTPEPEPSRTEAASRGSPACFTSVQNQALEVEAYGAYPSAILAYLNGGGSPIALSDILNIQGAAAQPVSVAIADFTGDGLDDLAVAIVHPAGDDARSNLLIFTCVDEGYVLPVNKKADDLFMRGFHIWNWQDLDGDGAAELVISQGLCGAHTCFDDLIVLGWEEGQFVNRFEGSTAEFPFPLIEVIDEAGDGIYKIEVASGGFGSVGAGPPRTMTYIWRLNLESKRWQQAEIRAAPSNFRIHVLHDADDASARAEYDYAVQLYHRVIEDETLDEWMVVGGNPTLPAYAYYRIFVTAIALEDRPAADVVLSEMEDRYPVGDPLHDFVEMAILFRNAYDSGGLGAACTGAAGFAESNAQVVLDPLGSQFYGYGNRTYTGESMCPAPVLNP